MRVQGSFWKCVLNCENICHWSTAQLWECVVIMFLCVPFLCCCCCFTNWSRILKNSSWESHIPKKRFFFFYLYNIIYKGFFYNTVLNIVFSYIPFYVLIYYQFSSVQFSHSVVSDSLWPRESQHARPPCPSPTPGVYPNSCPLSWWCQHNHLILCRPLPLLPSIFPSIRIFSNESALHIRWPKDWSFSVNHQKFSFSLSP